MKKDKNKGVFGRATLGYGTNDRYQASANANIFNNNKQLSVSGNTNNYNSAVFNSSGGGGGGNQGSGGMNFGQACRRQPECRTPQRLPREDPVQEEERIPALLRV